MIRAVQEFFCSQGRCREVQLTDGPRYPVRLSVEQIRDDLDTDGGDAAEAPGLWIRYRGHKEDLVALGCISRERLAAARYDRYENDSRGGIRYVESKAAPGRRGVIELSYFAQSRAFAGILPGVRTYCADWLEGMAGRPRLRLVVDNTCKRLS